MVDDNSGKPRSPPPALASRPKDSAVMKGEGQTKSPAASGSRRQWERSAFSIKVTLTLDNREFPPLVGVTDDVSLNGVKFRPSRTIPPLPVGIEGALAIALEDGPMTFRCRAVRITNTHIFLNLLGKEALFGQAITVEAFRSIKRPAPDRQ
ncbi:MAG: PilZ domain-containing protein [Magnetococcales bacterium]|nr:PilZ domain-containing protein [Magnetococcales bacterium]